MDIRSYFGGGGTKKSKQVSSETARSKTTQQSKDSKKTEKTPTKKSSKKTPAKSSAKTRVRSKSRENVKVDKNYNDNDNDDAVHVISTVSPQDENKSTNEKPAGLKKEHHRKDVKMPIVIQDSESEEDPLPNKKSKKKKKKQVIFDSDDEDKDKSSPTMSPFFSKRDTATGKCATTTKIKTPKSTKSSKQGNLIKTTPISVMSFFGEDKIKPSKRKTPVKRKLAKLEDDIEILPPSPPKSTTPKKAKLAPHVSSPQMNVRKSPRHTPGKKPKQQSKERDIKQEAAKFETTKVCDEKRAGAKMEKQESSIKQDQIETTTSPSPSLMWVDKYKPQTMKQIIGQQGDKSNANKLINWLKNWHRDFKVGKKKAGYNKFSNDGNQFKAALLSGPPGVGKTTTATLVCQKLGFSYVELNASDTRSNKNRVVLGAFDNTSMVDFLGSNEGEHHGHNHCLLMDEVEGMAGGMQQLVQLIKQSKIPIICMCNDRQSQKVRSLANYCFDLRFYRPRVEQIKGAMMSMCFKEGIKIQPSALNEVIQAANQDVRQVIHNLSMWSVKEKSLTYDQCKSGAKMAKKDLKCNPFDVSRMVFVGGEEGNKMTIDDKMDLFFQDPRIGPLFVQENYVNVTPYAAGGNLIKQLSLLAKAADAIADGDVVSRQILRSYQDWSLLNKQAFFSSIIPGDIMRGHTPNMMTFPSWLGRNSTHSKNDRILQELHSHMRLQISANKESLGMEYLPHLRDYLTDPLIKEETAGVPTVIKLMDEYALIREDFDNVLEVTKWPNIKDPMSLINTKTKSAFTRTYNKESHMTPYSLSAPAKKKRGGGGGGSPEDELGLEEDQQVVSDAEDGGSDEDIANNPMIKAKAKPKAKESKAGGTSKGKGGGKAVRKKGK